MKTDSNRRGGFTLVEIMIVVAIIGMLASIAVPNYRKARERTYVTSCITHLRQIEGAAQTWALENKIDGGQPVTLANLRPYLRSTPVCPAGGTTFEDSYELTAVDEVPLCKRRPDTHKLNL